MATITLEEITNELLGNPPSSTNLDNTIDDDDPIDSSQYTQEDLDYWQEQEDKRNTFNEEMLSVAENEEDQTAIGSIVNTLREQEEYADLSDTELINIASEQYYQGDDSTTVAVLKDIGGGILELPQAIAGGVENALNETADFFGDVGNWIEDELNIGRLVFPEGKLIPEYWSREEVKQGWEDETLKLKDSVISFFADTDIVSEEYDTVTGAVASGITQFGAAMIGVGKLTRLKSGVAGLKGFRNTMINAGITDAVAFDPDEANLAAMLKEFGWAENIVADYLATDMTEGEDNRFKNRLKNMGEGVILGGSLELLFRGVKKVKLGRQARAEINENGKASDKTVGMIADQDIAIANALDKQKGKTPKGPKISDKTNWYGQNRQIDLDNIKYNTEAEAKKAETTVKRNATKNSNIKLQLAKEFEANTQVPKVTKDIKDANGNTVDFEYARNKDGEIVYTSAKGMIVKDGKIDKNAYRRLGQILLRNPDRITEHTRAVDSIKAEQLKEGKIKEGEDITVDQMGLTVDDTIDPFLNESSLDRIVNVAADFRKLSMEKNTKFKWNEKQSSIDNLFDMAITQKMDGRQLLDILNKNDMTYNQFILATVGSFSKFGKGLAKAREINKYGRGLKSLVGEAKHKEMMDRQSNIGKYWLRIENLRRGAMVSSIATASRNLTSALIRMPLEGLGNVMDQAIYDLGKGGIGTASANLFSGENFKNSFKSLSYLTARDLKGLDDWFFTYGKDMDKWRDKMYGQLNEMRRITGKKEGESIGTAERVLQGMEFVVDTVNTPNRMQEFLIRRSVFFGEMQRLMKREWNADFMDLLDKGKIKSIIGNDNSIRTKTDSMTFEQLMESATTKTLDVTYAKQANTPMFREATTFITKYGGTLIMPFPRFMFNALELMGNYAGGASLPLTRKIGDLIRGDKESFKSALTDMDRQRISRNLVGVAAAMAAYQYRMGAKSEDYKVIDADMISEDAGIDTTPQFPMRQYLWVGEAIKRIGEGTFSEWFDLKDVAETFGGTNVRVGTGQVIIEDIAKFVSDANMDDLVTSERMGKSLGDIVGNYLSSWAIPIAQVSDFQRAVGLRQSAMKDPIAGDDLSVGFGETFKQQVTAPLERRGIFNLLKPSAEEELPDKQYLFQRGETKDRIAPALRAFFGVNVVERDSDVGEWMKSMGIKEWKQQSRSGVPSIRNIENKLLRELLPTLKEESEEVEKTFKKAYKDLQRGDISEYDYANLPSEFDYVRNEVKDYVKKRLSELRSTVADVGFLQSEAPALLQQFAEYKKLDSASRKRAINVFKLKHGGELPDYTNVKDVAKLNAYADLKP